jgi:hypothetical protein
MRPIENIKNIGQIHINKMNESYTVLGYVI